MRELCRDLGDARDVGEASAAAERWIRSAVGADAALAIARPDAAGRLRLASRTSGRAAAPTSAVLRREVFASRRTRRVRVAGSDTVVAVLPLVARGRAVGVLEVHATSREIDRGWDAVLTVADLLARQLGELARDETFHRELETVRRASGLGSELARARTPGEAVDRALGFLSDAFRVPVAAWCADGRGEMSLANAHGLGAVRLRALRHALPLLAPWASLAKPERREVKRRFANIMDADRVRAIDAGTAVLLIADPSDAAEGVLEILRTLLADVLRLLTATIDAEGRLGQLEMGLAWTAHELRGPILGVRAVLEVLLGQVQRAGDLTLLRRSLAELDRLAATSEAMLDFATGSGQPEMRPTDVVALVEESIDGVRLETGEDRIILFAPARAVANVDPPYLRPAIANLFRNALAYSDPGTKVEAAIAVDHELVELTVRNVGPGVSNEERQAIFAPFVRGSATDGMARGRGLGLFIARRAVLAHGGRIWVDSDGSGATFHVALPVGGRERQRFAS